MRAAILSIGDELTLGQNIDTNSAWLSARLAERSILTVEHRTLADDQPAIAAAISDLAGRCDVVVITGGLGPTADDLTREALAAAAGQELVVDDHALERLLHRFKSRGIVMPEMNRKQALRPAEFKCLANPNGTAPGLSGALGGCRVFALPGSAREMQPMFESLVLPELPATGQVLLTGMVQSLGLGESAAAEKIANLMVRGSNPIVGTTVSDAIVSARIRVSGSPEWARAQLDRTVAIIEKAWYPYAFGREDDSIGNAVGRLLEHKLQTLAVAESCTGGWLAKTIVDRAGSSAYFLGGYITYANRFKTELVNVPAAMIERAGAVSAEVAEAMAAGTVTRSDADWALAITGIAGPDGGSRVKPVGLVYIALAGIALASPVIRRFVFPGDRMMIRDRSVKAALQMLRFALIEAPGELPMLWEAPEPALEPEKAQQS